MFFVHFLWSTLLWDEMPSAKSYIIQTILISDVLCPLKHKKKFFGIQKGILAVWIKRDDLYILCEFRKTGDKKHSVISATSWTELVVLFVFEQKRNFLGGLNLAATCNQTSQYHTVWSTVVWRSQDCDFGIG